MKHDWKRGTDGEVVPLNEDADHPVGQCRACGATSGCLHADPYCSAIGETPGLDDDDCEGLDLNVIVTVTIAHPGEAKEYRDQASVKMSTILPLADVMSAKHDLAVYALGNVAESVTEAWRAVRETYEAAWRTAVDVSAPQPETRP